MAAACQGSLFFSVAAVDPGAYHVEWSLDVQVPVPVGSDPPGRLILTRQTP
jgi:hypothetical protein